MEHDAEPRRALLLRRELEPRARRTHRRLRPGDPLPHRGLGNQEGPGDLRGGEPADRPQHERELRRHGERGVAAEVEERERVVARAHGLRGRADRLERDVLVLPPAPRGLAAHLVDQPPPGDRHEPRPRVLRQPVARPLHGRRQERLLHRVLARAPLPVAPHERPEDLRRELAQQALDPGAHTSGGPSAIRRTSIGAPTKSTTRVAISIARASLSTSSTQ